MDRPSGATAHRTPGTRVTLTLTRRAVVTHTAAAGGVGLLAAACGPVGRETQAKAPEPSTIRYLWVDTGQAERTQNFQNMFSMFEVKQPRLKLQVDSITLATLADKLLTTLAGGDYYDITFGHYSLLSPLLQGDAIQPLDPFLTRDRDVSANDFYDAATERVKGKTYGLAFATNGKEIWYNADLLAQAGVTTPKQLERDGKWTWDALIELARKLTKVEGGEVTQYGFGHNFSSAGWYVHNLWAWGAEWYDKGFTKTTIDSPQFLAATEFAVDVVGKQRTATATSVGPNFNTRKVAMMVNGSTNTRAINEQVMQRDPFKVEMALLPKGPGGRAVALSNNCNYLIKGAKAPDGAWQFYKHFISQDVQPMQAQNGNGRYTASKKIKPTTLYPYEDAAVYEASAKISRAQPLIVKQSEVDAAWTATWNDMVSGKQAVRPALTAFQDRVALALKDGGCIC